MESTYIYVIRTHDHRRLGRLQVRSDQVSTQGDIISIDGDSYYVWFRPIRG